MLDLQAFFRDFVKSVILLFLRLFQQLKLQSFYKDSRKKTIQTLYEMSAKVILQTFCIPYEKVGKI